MTQQVPGFGQWLADLLARREMSREMFRSLLLEQEDIQITQATLSYWLAGEHRPKPARLWPICRVLDGDPRALLAALAHEKSP